MRRCAESQSGKVVFYHPILALSIMSPTFSAIPPSFLFVLILLPFSLLFYLVCDERHFARRLGWMQQPALPSWLRLVPTHSIFTRCLCGVDSLQHLRLHGRTALSSFTKLYAFGMVISIPLCGSPTFRTIEHVRRRPY